ncbi:unnamed protein product [Echinostoma caproni]|uniref:WD_REPEATS_REGION domain-containing protein n=1 Tax=Echinostoma caproni TaxID=27848 RepID=A0A183AK59_9TREM|nr:unnamed protein product [Echinostoma caproni]
MDGLSNKISPLFNKLLANPVIERVIGKDESVSPVPSSPSENLQHSATAESGPLSGQLWDVSSRQAQSRYLQARQLGRLDPALYVSEETEDLYEITPGHLGRIWFTVTYSKSNELLKVTVHKARNLRQLSLSSGASVGGVEHAMTANDDSTLQDFRINSVNYEDLAIICSDSSVFLATEAKEMGISGAHQIEKWIQ